jgi:hypothetical protein
VICSALAGLRFASVLPAFCIRAHSPNKKEGKSLVLQDNLPPAQWIVYTVSVLLFDAVKFCQINAKSGEYHYTDP